MLKYEGYCDIREIWDFRGISEYDPKMAHGPQ